MCGISWLDTRLFSFMLQGNASMVAKSLSKRLQKPTLEQPRIFQSKGTSILHPEHPMVLGTKRMDGSSTEKAGILVRCQRPYCSSDALDNGRLMLQRRLLS